MGKGLSDSHARKRLPSIAVPRAGANEHHWVGVSGGVTTFGGSQWDEEHCMRCGIHRQIEIDDEGAHYFEVEPLAHNELCESGHPECGPCGTAALTLEAAQREPKAQTVISARDALELELQGRGFTRLLPSLPHWQDWEWHDCRWWRRPEVAIEVQLFENYPRTGTLRYRVMMPNGHLVFEERTVDLSLPVQALIAELAADLGAATLTVEAAVAEHACGTPDCAQKHRTTLARLISEEPTGAR